MKKPESIESIKVTNPVEALTKRLKLNNS